MNLFTFFWKSSIGKKWLVAITGLIWVGYVIAHLVGNLQVFFGPGQINDYAAFLHSIPAGLWAARIVLIVALILHIVLTIKLTAENRTARPERYQKKAYVQATAAARTMMLSGPLILAFIIFHLLHLTTRDIYPDYQSWVDPLGRTDVYRMLIAGFQSWLVSGFYVVAIVLLCLHLSHGFSSLLQTLGINSKRTMGLLSKGGRALAVLIAIGYISIPVAVLFGGLGKTYLAERAQAPVALTTPTSQN